MKFGTTYTSRIDSGSNTKIASRKLGSSFQKAHSTPAKAFRRRISAACASVGALESGFTVEPCATINRALSSLRFIQSQKTSNVQRSTSNAQFRKHFTGAASQPQSMRATGFSLNIESSTLSVGHSPPNLVTAYALPHLQKH